MYVKKINKNKQTISRRFPFFCLRILSSFYVFVAFLVSIIKRRITTNSATSDVEQRRKTKDIKWHFWKMWPPNLRCWDVCERNIITKRNQNKLIVNKSKIEELYGHVYTIDINR